jgi:DNA-binding XRE family transcriptional regulator
VTLARANRDVPARLELGGRRYVVLSERCYDDLVAAAGGFDATDAAGWAAWDEDAETLGERLAERRREAGLSQVSLARLAGIRVETLNRIEKGKTSPDFGTVRKLVLALRGARTARTGTSGRRTA